VHNDVLAYPDAMQRFLQFVESCRAEAGEA
jgi:hypothetical protein